MVIAPDLLEQIVEHARREAPNECCGLISFRDGRAVGVHPATNAFASPFRFKVDEAEQLALMTSIWDSGCDVGGIYHSHTRSDPYPSQTDVNVAEAWDDSVEWVIVGLRDGQADVRSYLIGEKGAITQVEIPGSDAG
jgi:[CysO sulfur-carrier protein]-S-L-cysteine hydrolase